MTFHKAIRGVDDDECPCLRECEARHKGKCTGHVRTCAMCKRKVCYTSGADDFLDDLLSAVKEVRRHGGDGGLCDECASLIMKGNPQLRGEVFPPLVEMEDV